MVYRRRRVTRCSAGVDRARVAVFLHLLRDLRVERREIRMLAAVARVATNTRCLHGQ